MKASARGRWVVGALLAFSLSGEVRGQEVVEGPDAATELDRFVGRWVAVRDGRVALWVELRREGATLGGQLAWRDDWSRHTSYADEPPDFVLDKRTGSSWVRGCTTVEPIGYVLDELSPAGAGVLVEARPVVAVSTGHGLLLRGHPRKTGAAPSELELRWRHGGLSVVRSRNTEGDGEGLRLERRDALFVAATLSWSRHRRPEDGGDRRLRVPGRGRLNAIRRGLAAAGRGRIADDFRESLCLLRNLVPDSATRVTGSLTWGVRDVVRAAEGKGLCDVTGAQLAATRTGPFAAGCQRVRIRSRYRPPQRIIDETDWLHRPSIGVVERRVGGWVLVGTEPSDAELPYSARRFNGWRDWHDVRDLDCVSDPIVARPLSERTSLEASLLEPWWPPSLDEAIRARRCRRRCATEEGWRPEPCIALATERTADRRSAPASEPGLR
ncbi:MAG: hypothetical protein AAGH15_16685 [Myxococcota bacterium]